MEDVKRILSKQVGPFTVGVWAIVLAGGVSLALVIRRLSGNRADSDSPGTEEGDTTTALTSEERLVVPYELVRELIEMRIMQGTGPTPITPNDNEDNGSDDDDDGVITPRRPGKKGFNPIPSGDSVNREGTAKTNIVVDLSGERVA